ncbi:MAG: hypothetical protein WC815_04075 [Vicinamibacterales bacterium]
MRDRDQIIDELRSNAGDLEGLIGELDADAERASAAIATLRSGLSEAREQLETERDEATLRLESLGSELTRQRKRIEANLSEIAARHARDMTEMQGRIESLAAERVRKDVASRRTAEDWLREANEIVQDLPQAQLDAMDLVGEYSAARARIVEAAALVASESVGAAELASASAGALTGVLRLQGTLRSRTRRLDRCRADLAAAAHWLTQLAQGAATTALPEQNAEIKVLLGPEFGMVAAMVDRHVRQPAAALLRWNGHGALLARIDAIAGLLSQEIIQARRDLPDAITHEAERYEIGWLWDDLEFRFGRIRDEGRHTAGAWGDASDRKSPYSFFLTSDQGEVTVVVPWVGPLQIWHGGRAQLQVQPPITAPESVCRLGQLTGRWVMLDDALANPAHSRSSIEGLFGSVRKAMQ